METIYNRGKRKLRIDDSSLLTFSQSIVDLIEVPSYMDRSQEEVAYVKREARCILADIYLEMDGETLMKRATKEIGEILYYCENTEQEAPKIHFFDVTCPHGTTTASVFSEFVIWCIDAFYWNKIRPAKKTKKIPVMQEEWDTDTKGLVPDGRLLLVKTKDGVKLAKYTIHHGTVGFYHKKQPLSVFGWHAIDPADYTIEMCPECGEEVVIFSEGITDCSTCGYPVVPCSVCEGRPCDHCPYEQDIKRSNNRRILKMEAKIAYSIL
uniref:hypothetical protein n=1 Tax=Lachnoclostridium phocaeense TaxID=1871021 RepID=UPI0026DBCFCF|nr:hypothetical protein [Lachnoclostridium phocaeense]